MSAQTLCKHPGYRQCYLELLQSQGGSRKCENLGLLASHLREEGPTYRAPMATEKGPPCSSLEAELVSLLDLCLPVHILLAFSTSSAAISSQLPCLLFIFQPTASTFLSNCSFELYHEFAHHPTKWQLSASILLELCAPAFAVGQFILLNVMFL